MRVPFFDLQAANAPFAAEVEAAVLRVARSGQHILGPEVEAFEAAWAAYCGTEHCVGCGNALDGLRMILMAQGIGPGDEVIVPANTYIATWLAVSLAGAVPVPVEPDAATFNLDPGAVAAAVTPRTAAIIAVHLYGRCADMLPIADIASQHGLLLVEDAAQAHGAQYLGSRAGSLGDAAAFSFYPTKNLGAMGDAGAVTTNDAQLAAKVRRLRNYGGAGRLDHQVRGINSRLDELQAAVLRAKLPHLGAMNGRRAGRADAYDSILRRTGLVLPETGGDHAWHQYVVCSADRDGLQADLARLGIETLVHYPVPPHLEAAYSDLGYGEGAFPVTERLARSVLSLPIGYKAPVGRIADTIVELCGA